MSVCECGHEQSKHGNHGKDDCLEMVSQYGHKTWDGKSKWLPHYPLILSTIHIAGIALNEHAIHQSCQRAGVICR